jgi:VCBS repeat-containing protein
MTHDTILESWGSVLDNDFVPDFQALSISLASGPENGTVDLRSDGSFTYTPQAGFVGADSFVYVVSNADGSDEATVHIGIFNTSPVTGDDWYAATHSMVIESFGSVLDNDFDPDGDPLTVSLFSGPSEGTLDFRSDGSFTYTPPSLFVGTISFVYEASDSITATLGTVSLNFYNSAPSTMDDWYSGPHDMVIESFGSVLDNDSDPDGDWLTVTLAAGPANGALEFRPDGTFTYTPVPRFVGIDSFLYEVNDGIATTQGTVYLGLNNSAPAVEDDSGFNWLNPLTGLTQFVNYFVLRSNVLSVTAQQGVLKNDWDPDLTDQPFLTAHLVTNGMYGSVSLSADGSFTYSPYDEVFDDPNFVGLTDAFTYYAQDPHGAQSGYAVVYVDLAAVILKREVLTGAPFPDWTFEPLDHPNHQQPWVGEQVSLKAEVIGNVGGPVLFEWTIDNRAIKGYTGFGNQTTAAVQELTAVDLGGQVVSFYWVDGGMKSATVQVTAMGQAVGKSADFDVIRPPAQLSADTTDVNYIRALGVVTFGNPGPPSEDGIVFTYDFGTDGAGVPNPNPEGDRGTYVLTQLVTSTLYRQRTDIPYVELKSGFGVDGDFSYEVGQGLGWRDSPLEPVPVPGQASWPESGLDWMSREDNFESYLMYNPQRGRDPIFVPLQVIYWSWWAYLVYDNGWELIDHGGTENQHIEGVDTLAFPEFDTWIQREMGPENEWQIVG